MSQAIILPCSKTCEGLLAKEAATLGLREVKEGVAVVSGVGDLQTAYRLCLWSRFASRVLWVLARGTIENPQDLYDFCAALPWDEHLSAEHTFAVRFSGSGSGIDNSQFGALKTKDAIVDVLRAKLHRRPNVDNKNPELSVDVHLRRGALTLALDLSGGALHQRGYRQAQGSAPLKEHLAATVLTRASWAEKAQAGASLIDPMCGSGTLLIEAALMAADIAPGLLRTRFGFEHWQSHIPALWRALRAEADARRIAGLQTLKNRFYGFDAEAQVLRFARENAARAGLEKHLHFERRPITALSAEPAYGTQGLIVVNPPYGKRLGNAQTLVTTYAELGAAFKRFGADWSMAVISDEQFSDCLRLRAEKRYRAFNGAMETQIALYQRKAQFEGQNQSASPLSSGAQMLANRLRKNLKLGRKAAAQRETNAWRLYDRDLPEYAFAIDLYADWAHVQEYAPPETIEPKRAQARRRDLMQVLPAVLDFAPEHIVFKTRQRQEGRAQYEKCDDRGEGLTVHERGAILDVNLTDYLDTGLFLDHRPLRYRIREEAKDKRVLNLFCYTAAFSVHAALGGAHYTTSVDLSQNYLDWAHRNFDLNQLSDRHRLIHADVMAYLREGTSLFDLIICDPPTFSNTKKTGRVFDVQSHHRELIERCMTRLAPEGVLYFSNNFRRFRLDEALKARYAIADISKTSIDFDFARHPNIHRVFRISQLEGAQP